MSYALHKTMSDDDFDDVPLEKKIPYTKSEESFYSFEVNDDTNINFIHKRISAYLVGQKNDLYSQDVKELLSEYNRAISKDVNVEDIVRRYIEISKTHYSLICSYPKVKDVDCPCCNQTMIDNVCDNCGISDSSPKDKSPSEGIKIKDGLKSFEKCVLDFEGRKPISSSLSRPISAIIGDIDVTSVESMIISLARHGIVGIEKEKHNIHYYLTKKPRHDIGNIRENIFKRYAMVDNIYLILKKTYKRNNSLNKQFILWSLLNSEGYEIKSSKFDILKTIDSLETHNTIMRRIYLHLSVNDDTFEWSYKEFI